MPCTNNMVAYALKNVQIALETWFADSVMTMRPLPDVLEEVPLDLITASLQDQTILSILEMMMKDLKELDLPILPDVVEIVTKIPIGKHIEHAFYS